MNEHRLIVSLCQRRKSADTVAVAHVHESVSDQSLEGSVFHHPKLDPLLSPLPH